MTDRGYLGLDDRYPHGPTDHPTVLTSYVVPGCPAKSIYHYSADRSAPRELREIEAGIDRIVGVERWTREVPPRAP
jgi:hypothetical protein